MNIYVYSKIHWNGNLCPQPRCHGLEYQCLAHTLKTFNYLLAQNGIDVNLKNDFDKTALIIAAQKGHMDMVNILLDEHDADTSLVNKKGQTAAMVAKNKDI